MFPEPWPEDRRRTTWRSLGASDEQLEELLRYGDNAFRTDDLAGVRLPLPSERFAEDWKVFARRAATESVESALREAFIELAFPVRVGMSQSPAYSSAKKLGVRPDSEERTHFEFPESLDLQIRPSAAGELPVITVAHRADFETLLRAVAHKNEPAPIPAAMGAFFVGGYNNWGRIELRRRELLARDPELSPEKWKMERSRIFLDKPSFQDKIMFLSIGPYSGVPASVFGRPAPEWNRISTEIRFAHECAHALTKRLLGSMRLHVHDELVADFAGLRAGLGTFSKSVFETLFGIENESPKPEGRIHTYKLQLTDPSLRIVTRMVSRAARVLEQFAEARASSGDLVSSASDALSIAIHGLESLSSPETVPSLVRTAEGLDERLRGQPTAEA